MPYFILLMLSVVTFSTQAQTPSDKQASERETIVVELFTSQGCYSCPPADKLLGELGSKASIIPISCHVTYWNYLGWKDTFSKKFCDNRQRSYQDYLTGGRRGVYTPQMIINGRYAGVGSQKQTINAIIDYDQQKSTPVNPIELSLAKDQITLSIEQANINSRTQLLLLGTSGSHLLPISLGENAGKKLPYHHPIAAVKNLGKWEGEATSITTKLPKAPAIKHWIVLAQQWPVGEIIAAGRINSH